MLTLINYKRTITLFQSSHYSNLMYKNCEILTVSLCDKTKITLISFFAYAWNFEETSHVQHVLFALSIL